MFNRKSPKTARKLFHMLLSVRPTLCLRWIGFRAVALIQFSFPLIRAFCMSLRNSERGVRTARCSMKKTKQEHKNQIRTNSIEKMEDRKKEKRSNTVEWYGYAPPIVHMLWLHRSCGFVLAVHFCWWDRRLNVYSLCLPHAFFAFIIRCLHVCALVCVCVFFCFICCSILHPCFRLCFAAPCLA